MYLSLDQIAESHDNLEKVHPFYLITFLTCKYYKLPVGKALPFQINKFETDHLAKYFKPNPMSVHFYKVSSVGRKFQKWVKPDYASSGSQKTRTTTFQEAFIHEKKTDLWGWKSSYIPFLRSKLKKPIPAFHLAVWLFRDENWSVKTKPTFIIEKFFKEFNITDNEKKHLFDVSLPDKLDRHKMFQDELVTWRELQVKTSIPPDAIPEEGGALSHIELRGLGPSLSLSLSPADRINLITGDNGLGKTFLLDCAWWALSGVWANLPAYPRKDAKKSDPEINFTIGKEGAKGEKSIVIYEWETMSWPIPSSKRPTIPGLVVYAQVDGSFSLWDPARMYIKSAKKSDIKKGAFLFSSKEIWNGLESKEHPDEKVLCNGILRDWITWQNSKEPGIFNTFRKVLKRLSPSDLGDLEPGEPTRLPDDVREIPTIKHPYGDVPLLHVSAGVKRIIAIAYLLVWAWQEHKTLSQLLRKPIQRKMVVLIDEIEAHLHPKWQRSILPALIDVCSDLSSELQTQFIIGTHSPLVMASLEPMYDEKQDKLFHLKIQKNPDDIFESLVELKEMPFIRHGRTDRWLISDTFDLKEARSIEAEKAIHDALEIQEQKIKSKSKIADISKRLMKCLAAEDSFWPRWVHFAEKHGVEL